ncbi:Uncharacterized protein SCF082_LOCUS5961 [Durusdinium trenchii]|uniref:Uncharacterized protein n=1 Tax=Durusdinium trenchii TaxID=1381693 RepID=A0ABP0IBB0_9DINO
MRHGWVTVEAIDYVKLQKVLHDAGFHVLAYDLRNHGESEKKLPSGFGEIEYMDAVGVMNYVNSHPVLKTCKVCLLPFCVSGVAFMKANTLHPEKFKNVVAWATTNIFHGPTIMSNRPYMFGLGNVKLLNKAFAEKQDIKITAQRISAKPYVFYLDYVCCDLPVGLLVSFGLYNDFLFKKRFWPFERDLESPYFMSAWLCAA